MACEVEQGATVVGLDNVNDYYDVNLKEARLARLEGKPGYKFVRIDLENREGIADLFAGLGTFAFSLANPAKALAVEAAQQGFMEGRVHIYTPRNSTPFPGLLLATGLEDYCESSNIPQPSLV